MWTSCAALRLIRMKVHRTAWAAAKPITSTGASWRSVADATSHAASRRGLSQRRRDTRRAEGENDADDMPSWSLVTAAPDESEGAAIRYQVPTGGARAFWVARFSLKWNQLDVKKPRRNDLIWLPRGNANAIPRP